MRAPRNPSYLSQIRVLAFSHTELHRYPSAVDRPQHIRPAGLRAICVRAHVYIQDDMDVCSSIGAIHPVCKVVCRCSVPRRSVTDK